MPRNTFVPAKSPRQLEYERYLRSPRWRWFLRPLRIWLDGGRCRLCNRNTNLQVHHRSYAHLRDWWWRELADLTTLCNSCHSNHHVVNL